MALRKPKQNVEISVGQYGTLISAVLTEKGSSVNMPNRAVFHVARDASKDQIREAVEKIFKVNVTAINTINYQGKAKRTARGSGRRAAFKKAYITVREGQNINVVEAA